MKSTGTRRTLETVQGRAVRRTGILRPPSKIPYRYLPSLFYILLSRIPRHLHLHPPTTRLLLHTTRGRGLHGKKVRLVEDDGLVAIQEHSLLRPPLDGGREHLTLDIAALVDELLGRHTVVHPGHSLFDDGTFIQVGRDEMRRRSDDLDAALVGLVVGLGALE